MISTATLLLLALLQAPLSLGPAWVPAPQDLAGLEQELEARPSDPDLLLRAAEAAKAADDPDKALWYAILAGDAAGDDRAYKKQAAAALAMIGELAPEGASYTALLDTYGKSLLGLAKTCEGKKLYANAVDLLFRCEGTRYEKPARDKLEKLFSKDKAVDALMASGIEIPTRPSSNRSPEWIAKEDPKHVKWEEAWEIEGKNYTVVTNAGYEMGHTLASALAQMNGFFRKKFNHEARGGSMRQCVVQVYRSRADFDANENMGPSVGGYFSPGENRVVTFIGRDPADLWETLFHECAHQFKHAMTSNLIPAWWNEGLACYFEGAQLSPSGSVTFNAVAAHRLRSLLPRIDGNSPNVEQVIEYFSPGSYAGSHYAFGWGLVYFILNYENEESERVFAPLFQDYFNSYRKGGGQHDVLARFTDVIVKEAEVPGVDDFPSFKKLWIAWIRDLGDIYFGPPEKADILVERAAKQVANGKHEYAAETLKWAVDKRPGDPQLRFLLSDAYAEIEQDDGAIFHLRKAIEIVRALGPEDKVPGFEDKSADEVIALALTKIEAVNRHVAKGISEGEGKLIEGASAASAAFAEAGFPRTAVHLLNTTEAVLGGDASIAATAMNLRKEHGVDVRRWRRLPVAAGLEAFEIGDGWSADGDALSVAPDGSSTAILRQDMPSRYTLEASIEPGEGESFAMYGLIFGSNIKSGSKQLTVIPHFGFIGLLDYEESGMPDLSKKLGARVDSGAKAVQLAVEVEPGKATFFLDGKEIGSEDFGRGELTGRVGVFANGMKAVFRDLRVRH